MIQASSSLRRVLVCVATVASLAATAGSAAANPTVAGSTSGDGLIYLPMYYDGTVQAIDPVAQRVVKTIPNVGDHPLVIKSTLDHKKIYVGNFGPITAEVGVIDVASGTVVKKIPTFGAPYAVSLLSHSGRYFVVPTALSVVQFIDTQTDTVVRTLPIALPPGPAHLELSLDDSVLYVLSAFGTATKYDAVTGQVLGAPLAINGLIPGWGALSTDGNTLYTINYFGGVTFIDVPTWTVTRTVPFGTNEAPLSATLTPDGSKLWVCNLGTNEIVVMDAHNGAILQRIKTDEAPIYTGFSADGKRAYVSTLGDFSDIPPEAGIVKILTAYTGPREPGFLDTYDTTTGVRIARMHTGDAPIAGVYPK